jgi:hypothetical protein
MSYSNLKYAWIFLILVFSINNSFGQRFTSNQNGNWLTAGTWTRDNPTACGTLRNAPPATNDYGVDCRVDVVINHEVFFNSANTFGGGYFRTLTVNGTGGNLIFQQNLEFNTSGSSLAAPNNVIFNVTNGGQINVPNGQITVNRGGVINITGNSTVVARDLVLSSNNATINVEEGSRLIILNTTTLNSNTTLNINGEFVTNNLSFSSGGILNAEGNAQIRVRNNLTLGNGTFNANNQSDIRVGGNFAMSGGGRFNGSGESYVQVSGNLNISSNNTINLNGNSGFIVDGDRNGNANIVTGGGGCYQSANNGNSCEIIPGSPCSTETFANSGQEVIITFYCNASWLAPEDLVEYEVLVVGGGGAGGRTNNGNANKAGGGGGGGAVIFQTIDVPSGVPANASYPITIGAGGNGAATLAAERNGQSSTFNNGTLTITAGGGAGGGMSNAQNGLSGSNGSSAGGAGAQSTNSSGSGGSGNGSGRNGGNSSSNGNSANQFGGGGGGAGSNGLNGTGSLGGAGGSGISNAISGIVTIYGSGGGGGVASGTVGSGGSGAGNGGSGSVVAGNGMANTGSGGGGGGGNNRVGGNGGSGIVVVRYAIARILPVEFLSFSAAYFDQSRNVQLNWATAKEWNNSHFEIQRSIENVRTWENIGQVVGMGWSEATSEYSFVDESLPVYGGLVYYRLKQVDFDGKESLSKTISARIPAKNSDSSRLWRLYPNPVKDGTVTIESLQTIPTSDNFLASRLYTSSGLVLSAFKGDILEISDWASGVLRQANPGLYFLEINYDNQIDFIKVVKK